MQRSAHRRFKRSGERLANSQLQNRAALCFDSYLPHVAKHAVDGDRVPAARRRCTVASPTKSWTTVLTRKSCVLTKEDKARYGAAITIQQV